MKIVDRFCAYIAKNKLLHATDRVLLAVSGGRDSMLMLWLFHTVGIDIEVAHCNFLLRGTESDGDETLVRRYCNLLNIPIQVQNFETEVFAQENKISIQMAARQLRYAWFKELAKDLNCQAIAIAQHKNDHIETALLNLARGTGLAGLQGILPKRGQIIRPLLFLDSKEITAAVAQFDIPYRDDSSNFSNKYSRNKIRLDIVPQFEKLHPSFVETMGENIARFQDAHNVLQTFVGELRQKLFIQKSPAAWEIDKETLRNRDLALLYYLFEPFGFSKAVLYDLQNALDKDSGRILESPSHQILVDRKKILLQKTDHTVPQVIAVDSDSNEVCWQNMRFKMVVSEDLAIISDPNIAKLDWDKLVFPLQVRSWQEGDYFHPLGMQGKKKLSDFFIQKKITLFEKKNIPIWLNGNGDILWITEQQIDDRYKITENTQKVLTLVRQKQEV